METPKKSTPRRQGSYIEMMFQAKYGRVNITNPSLKRAGTLPARVSPVKLRDNKIGNPSVEEEVELPIRRSRSLNLDDNESSSSPKKVSFSSQLTTTANNKKRGSRSPTKRSSGHQRGSGGEKKTTRSSEKAKKLSSTQRGTKGSSRSSGSKQTTRKAIKSRTTTTRQSLHIENHNHNMSLQSLPEMPVSSIAPGLTGHDMSFKSLPDMPIHREEQEASSAMISDVDKVLMLPQAALLSLLQKSQDVIGSTTAEDMPMQDIHAFEPRPHGMKTKKLRKIHSLPTSLDEQRREIMDRSHGSSSTSVRMPRRRTIDDVIPDLREEEGPTTTTTPQAASNNSRPPAHLRSSTGSIPKEALAGPVNPWIAQLGRSPLTRINSEDEETRSPGLAAMSA